MRFPPRERTARLIKRRDLLLERIAQSNNRAEQGAYRRQLRMVERQLSQPRAQTIQPKSADSQKDNQGNKYSKRDSKRDSKRVIIKAKPRESTNVSG